MAKAWGNTETNSKKILGILEIKGALRTKELARRARLTKDQCFYAVHELTQNGTVELRDGCYQLTASKYAPLMIARLWNESIFEGLTL